MIKRSGFCKIDLCHFIYTFLHSQRRVISFLENKMKNTFNSWKFWCFAFKWLKISKINKLVVLYWQDVDRFWNFLLLVLWHYNPLSFTLGCLAILAYSCLSFALWFHILILNVLMSVWTSSNHLNLCLPIFCFPSSFTFSSYQNTVIFHL